MDLGERKPIEKTHIAEIHACELQTYLTVCEDSTVVSANDILSSFLGSQFENIGLGARSMENAIERPKEGFLATTLSKLHRLLISEFQLYTL